MRTASKLVIAEPDSGVFIATDDYSRSHLHLVRNAGRIGLQRVGLSGFNIAETLGPGTLKIFRKCDGSHTRKAKTPLLIRR